MEEYYLLACAQPRIQLLLYLPLTYFPTDGTTQNRMDGPPYIISTKENAPQTCRHANFMR